MWGRAALQQSLRKAITIPAGGARGQSHRTDGDEATAGGNALSCVKFALWRILLSNFEGIVMLIAPPPTTLGRQPVHSRAGVPQLSEMLVN